MATRGYTELHPHAMTNHQHSFNSILCFTHSTRRSETPPSYGRRNISDFVVEPASPRVGCMGQIKGEKTSGFSRGDGGRKFYKLKKIFSSRGLSAGISVDRPATPKPVGELDPPLPVRKPACGEEKGVSLWRRRCGAHLESLQLQPCQSLDLATKLRPWKI